MRKPLLLTGLFLGLLFLLPQIFTNTASILTLNQMGIAVILAISYNLLLGTAGLLSLGHAAYFGFGGFFAVHVIRFASEGESWISAPFIPLFGGLMGMFGAFVIGSFTTKRGGLIFAMLSFAMAELALASSTIFGRFYGGSIDRTSLPPVGDITFQLDSQVFYVVWIWVAICLVLAAWFEASPLGRLARAVGQNPDRVEYIGYSRRSLRYMTFCFSGFIAGIAGGLFALAYEFVTVEIISLQQSWQILQMVFIGGVGFFWGPPVGAALLTMLFSVLSSYTDIWNLYTGIVFLLIVLFAPKGLTGLAMSVSGRLRTGDDPGIKWYYGLNLGAIVTAFVGVIGLCEMVYFLKAPILVKGHLDLFWAQVNPYSPWPWLIFGTLAVVGTIVASRCIKRLSLDH
ncbi:MAG: branched-chain amino acid ABC transporter permease [Proteobacteria bacterium]|nr:branched-chain amino acid ABC transporter permease [Pseudomonadota bacterium]